MTPDDTIHTFAIRQTEGKLSRLCSSSQPTAEVGKGNDRHDRSVPLTFFNSWAKESLSFTVCQHNLVFVYSKGYFLLVRSKSVRDFHSTFVFN